MPFGLDVSEALRSAEPRSLDIPMCAARLISFASVNADYSPQKSHLLLVPFHSVILAPVMKSQGARCACDPRLGRALLQSATASAPITSRIKVHLVLRAILLQSATAGANVLVIGGIRVM